LAFPDLTIASILIAAVMQAKHRKKDRLAAVIPEQPAGLNPESRDSGFTLRVPRNDGTCGAAEVG
jgi:hypothetical protein